MDHSLILSQFRERIIEMSKRDKTRLSLVDIFKPTQDLFNYCMANNLNYWEITDGLEVAPNVVYEDSDKWSWKMVA